MRILILHNRYQQAGGEDGVVQAEFDLLRDAGHEVERLIFDNDGIAGTVDKIRTALSIQRNAASHARVAAQIAAQRPEVVHVHNTFPIATAAVLDACRDADVPVVMTLHNFRYACASATLMRDGAVCEDCVAGSTWPAVRHGCYRGSSLGTAPVAWMIWRQRQSRTWANRVDRFIALTPFAREWFARAGLPADRIDVKPNFVADLPPGQPAAAATASADASDRPYALFVGRLAPEKGIDTLLAAWAEHAPGLPLRIAGDGPLADRVRSTADGQAQIRWLGHQTPTALRELYAGATALVLPSVWYLIVISNRRADASLIAPLIYTQLIAATLAGLLVFGDWPDMWSLIGLVIILTSGLGTLALVRNAK